jgi:demethylmenaquinone methyltransferase/2-methoxy-6-polyprenyl-1,4-benzoquinol methylase
LTPYVQGKSPEKIFMRAPGSFQGAGLTKAEGRTFVGDVQAPLGDDLRRAMVSTFDMLWGERQPEVSAEDWREFQRLCRPDSPECILNLPDYYGFFTYSMFRGEVREA